jgi:hypothetical protein
MTTEAKKEGEFDPGCVTDIYDKLCAHNYALRAFGALLQSSDLDDFTDEKLATQLSPKIDLEAQNLRWGLSQIIDLYLAHQENILSEYCDLYYQSDTYITRHAEKFINFFQPDAWPADKLRETITNLDIVINRSGELKEKAAVLKETYLEYLQRVTGKKA